MRKSSKQLNRRRRAYCRSVSRRLPLGGRRKRDFLRQLDRGVADYLSGHPWADVQELREQFGSPEELAVSFVSELSAPEIDQAFRVRQRLLAVAVAAALLALGALALTLRQMWKENQSEINGYYEIVTPGEVYTT